MSKATELKRQQLEKLDQTSLIELNLMMQQQMVQQDELIQTLQEQLAEQQRITQELRDQ